MASRAEFLSLIKSWPDKSFINYYLTESSGFTISFSDYKDTIFKLYELWSKIVEEGFQYIGIQLSDFLWLPCLLVVIWKSGKACACIDSQYSEEWNLNFLDTLHVEYLISDSEKSTSSSELLKTFQINTQKFYIWKRNLPTVNKLLKTDLDICYGIMTSGSTGIPKIVQVPWSCILLNIYELISLLSISRSDNVYLCSPYTFDPFFVELFIPLITGCGLTIVSQKLKMVTQSLVTIFFKSKIFIHEEIKECEEINKFICRTGNVVNSNVTVFQMTPSIFRRWGVCNIRDIILSDTSPLRILLLGGEKFPMDLFKLKSKDNVTKVFNIYGITEISCWAFINELSEHCDEVSLGKPLNGIIYKIDENNELYIGSKVRKCIVGFENMEENEVLFRRTGDIVNVKEGTVYYVSRSNQVVKKFGIKVNLEKIERLFSDIHKIGECYCIFDEDTMKIAVFYENSNLEQNHCVVTEKGFSYSGLSSIEVPDHIIEVKALPLNSNGKCDRKSLLELLKSVMVKRVTVDVEKTFKKIWDHFVGCSNFISGGGDSVKALQIITSLEEAGINISKDFLLQILKNGDYDVCLKCLNQDSSPETERKRRRLNDGGINELVVLWKFDTRKCIDASPTIFEHNGMFQMVLNREKNMFFSGQIITYCTLTDEGISADEVQFSFLFVVCSGCMKLSTKRSPSENKTAHAVVGSHSSRLSSVKIDTGQENWTINLGDRIESGFSVNKSSTFGVIGCYDCHVYSISVLTGEILWRYKTDGLIKSTPCLSTDEKSVFVASYDTYLYRLKCQDGSLIVKIKLSDRGIFSSGITCHHLKTFYIATLDGSCICLCQETNDIRWKLRLEAPVFASPVLIDKHIIFTEVTGRLNCCRTDTGEKVWCHESNGYIYSTPCYYPPSNYLIYGCYDSHLYCLELSGQPVVKWKTELDSPVFGKPCLYQHDLVIVATIKGYIYIRQLEFGSGVGQVQLSGEIFSSPKIYLNNLIIGCRDNHLYSIKIMKT